MKKSDVVPALFMLGLSGAIAFDTRRLSFWDDTTPGPAFVPVWLAIAGALLFVLRLLEARRAKAVAIQWPDRAALTRVGTIFAALVAVPLLAPLLGFVATLSALVFFVVFVILRQALWPSLATVAVSTGLIYAIFVGWLGVALPKGLLGF